MPKYRVRLSDGRIVTVVASCTGKLSLMLQTFRRPTGSQAVNSPRWPPGPAYMRTLAPTNGVPAM